LNIILPLKKEQNGRFFALFRSDGSYWVIEGDSEILINNTANYTRIQELIDAAFINYLPCSLKCRSPSEMRAHFDFEATIISIANF
jgi:hypothetical protein